MDRLPFDFTAARQSPPSKRAKFPNGAGVPQPLLPYPRESAPMARPSPAAVASAAGAHGAHGAHDGHHSAHGAHGAHDGHHSAHGAHGAHDGHHSAHGAHNLSALTGATSAGGAHGAHGGADSESDEDERFLRLAREALVATATSVDGHHLVDPTIQDLLQRLQYASSPHGNPISHSSKIEANASGQLNIQGFYQSFPNLSNDIFMDISHPQAPGAPGRPHSRTSSSEYDDTDDGKRFRCAKCNQMFRRSSDLKRHEKQHLSVPANICDLCGKGFARKDALKRHRDTQTCRRNAEKKLYLDNLAYR